MLIKTVLPPTTIKAIKDAGNIIMPAISLAQAYANAGEAFSNNGVYFKGLDSQLEASENGKVVYSVFPRHQQSKKLYFIF